MTDEQIKALWVAGGVGFAALVALLARYNVARKGAANPWNLDAVINIIRLRKHIERARAEIDGSLNSVFRSPEYNASVPGSAKTSDHQYGAAVDLGPGPGWTAKSAANRLHDLAARGELGDVAQVIEEYKSSGASWVHVGWNHAKRNGRKLQRLTLLDSKRAPAGYGVA